MAKLIPIADQRYVTAVPVIPGKLETPSGQLADTLARPLRDLRIS
ncbi:MAG TPA: GTP 3',8-cyclase MoaA, partial [Oxalobacteraceae bacterium]|nr:GTP 3',8-cyclase MoaA [Oxalobacteraceae bacterium]